MSDGSPTTASADLQRAMPAYQRAREGPTKGGGVVLGMTLYNNARYLPEALESLLAQTHADFTIILLDDASVDHTESVARAV